MRVLHDQRKQEELQGEFFAKFPDTRERFLRQTLVARSGRSRALGAAQNASSVRSIVLQWLVGRGAADRVHQRRGPAARARRRAPARDRDPQRARRAAAARWCGSCSSRA